MAQNAAKEFADIRSHFPGAAEAAYFDTASRGLVPIDVKTVVDEQIDHRIRGDSQKSKMFETVERVRNLYAQLIHAAPHEIAFVKNVSEGLNIVAAGFSWTAGDNVVLCSQLEHPSNIYPWLNLRSRLGIEIRNVASVDGHMPVEEMIKAIDKKTRVVSCSLVTFAPGLRTDIQKLAEHCDKTDVLLVVDGAQSIGILDLDLRNTPISALSASTQKGLVGLYGMGFLYVRDTWASRLTPPFLSRFGVDLGDAHEASGGGDNYQLMPGARRFEVGNYNFLAAAAVEPGLNIVNKISTAAIEAHVLALTERMISGLQGAGLPVFAANHGLHRSSIVAIGDGVGNQHDTTQNAAMLSLYEDLVKGGVRLAIRRGLLRISSHFYNDEDDVDRVIDVAKNWQRKNNLTFDGH
jgi:selenocysteine lyase/cysteine desulfurase